MSWFYDGVERVCDGTQVRFGDHRGDTIMVAETPSEVREIMRASHWDVMIELHHHGDRELPLYVDHRRIIALVPTWAKVETS